MTAKTKIIPFPEPQTFPPAAAHRMSRGGMFMDIKHTHPEYATPEDRRQALLDTKRLCTAVLLVRKEAASKQSA